MISVVIPNHNQQKFVRQAIQSVIDQTWQDFEIIVVDDGSTDQSKTLIDEFSGKVNYIWQENKGLAGARNTGIRAAKGEFIALLDADDMWLPEYLETMRTLIDEHPKGSVYYSRAQCFDDKGNILPQKVGSPSTTVMTMLEMYQVLLRSNFLIPSTITLRHSVVVDAGYFDQSLRSCEDWDLWLRILPEKVFVGTSEVLACYRVHEQSLSANVSGMHTAKKIVVEKHFGPDDGQYETWSSDKRLTYAGLYRYFLVTSILRQGQWQMGSQYLRKCLTIDRSKSIEVDLFYELALGMQPVGYRGSTEKIDIEGNATKIMKLLDEVFQVDHVGLQSFKREAYGTACYAIGLCAYNTRHLALSRQYFQLAGKYRPELLFSSKLPSNWLKSWLGNRLLGRLRRKKLA